jgi:Histidine kinase-like ATPase domain
MKIEDALERHTRILAMSIGAGSALFALIGLGSMISQAAYLVPTFSWIMIIVVCGVPLAMGIVAIAGPLTAVRWLALAQALSVLVFIAFWYSAITVHPWPSVEVPWIMNLSAVPACCAALSFTPKAVWVYLGVDILACWTLRFLVSGGTDPARATEDAISIAIFAGVVVWLVRSTLRAGQNLDVAASLAIHDAIETNTKELLERQRTRYRAFTHDDVLGTLNAVARNMPGTRELAKADARRALEKLDKFRIASTADMALSATEFEGLVRRATEGLLAISVAVDDDARDVVRIPADVADALSEALTEALRNSIRHAQRDDAGSVLRAAHVVIHSDSVDIVVSDNGVGFSVRRIAIDRLGVRVSILERVNSQAGGFAEIQSVRGLGTTVTLGWVDEQARV